MARVIDANELEMFPYSEGAGTEEQIADWIEQAGLSEEDTADRARLLCWKVIEGCINVVKTQPTLTPPNEPLTLEQLREMDGEPVWFDTIKRWGIVKVCQDGTFILTKSGEFEVGYITRRKYYRRPPEGET